MFELVLKVFERTFELKIVVHCCKYRIRVRPDLNTCLRVIYLRWTMDTAIVIIMSCAATGGSARSDQWSAKLYSFGSSTSWTYRSVWSFLRFYFRSVHRSRWRIFGRKALWRHWARLRVSGTAAGVSSPVTLKYTQHMFS